jgi:hypothetical protein
MSSDPRHAEATGDDVDGALDGLLARAAWPPVPEESTSRLVSYWRSISPARRRLQIVRRVVPVASAAAIVIAAALVGILLMKRGAPRPDDTNIAVPVVLGSTEATVGPLVHGIGLAAAGEPAPCLHCLDLTRTDLDPAWPAVLAQLTRPAVGAPPEVAGETTLVAMAAAMTAMVALGALDGQPLPVGRSLEVGLPWPGVRQRDWPVHPRCSCASDHARQAPRGTAAGAPRGASGAGGVDTAGGPADGEAPARVRMAG